MTLIPLKGAAGPGAYGGAGMADLDAAAVRALRVQRAIGRACFPLVGLGSVLTMRVLRNNRVEGVARARRVFREALATRRPLLICANHLTMVDSAYLSSALAPLAEYLVHYRRFPWNVAAREHFERNPALAAIVYLGKVVPLDRDGDDAHRREVVARLRWLVSRGEVLMLFPEGTRSRTGRIDPGSVTYGVGQILAGLHRPLVLCAYLRGRRQQAASAVPAWGDVLDLELEPFAPVTAQRGLRAARDLSRQVIGRLKAMENAWLERSGRAQRASASIAASGPGQLCS
ncbi:MAG: 1-acyl-sn-glycerol-3-phosphate acyltransferase [Archangiaceae bacterium]|nr:1-acyl-sn-glycerol-3-phosphate acyltransferase [Archangiaceae bacterium]